MDLTKRLHSDGVVLASSPKMTNASSHKIGLESKRNGGLALRPLKEAALKKDLAAVLRQVVRSLDSKHSPKVSLGVSSDFREAFTCV